MKDKPFLYDDLILRDKKLKICLLKACLNEIIENEYYCSMLCRTRDRMLKIASGIKMCNAGHCMKEIPNNRKYCSTKHYNSLRNRQRKSRITKLKKSKN